MNRKNFAARTLIAGVAVTAMSLLAATPASAHTNNLFTYLSFDPAVHGPATLDRTSGVVTSLGTESVNTDFFEVVGLEVANEVGHGIATTSDDSDDAEFFGFGWDHSTGVETVPVPLYVDGAATGDDHYLDVSGLDTLADGTSIASIIWDEYVLEVEIPILTSFAAIASVNWETGELTPLIDTTDLTIEGEYFIWSLATDPIGGGTYGFLEGDDNLSRFVPFNFSDNSHGAVTVFGGAGFESGFFQGADFDADGTLNFLYGNNEREEFELSQLGAPSTWATAARTVGPDAASNFPGLDTYPLSYLALTAESAPALAETGAEFPALWLAAGGVAVITGVVTVVATKRRQNGAVV